MKILFNSEATYLNSGYSVFYRELMKRFHASGKYEIAELASYGSDGSDGDFRWKNIPWKYYPNNPNRNNQQEVQAYQSNPIYEFGSWRWEQTCLDFQPTVVCDIRDNWYCRHQLYSPFRRFYNLVWVPTVDSYPQKEDWISDYCNIDSCFTYTEWGFNVLKEQSNGQIPLKGVVAPGADTNIFNIIPDKQQLKKVFGLPDNIFIVGTTMRNQVRKLYPDLIEGFAKFLNDAPTHISNKTFLLLHTGWPDLGWDIPLLLKEFGITNRTLLTYICRNQQCQNVFCSLFQDTKTICPRCKQYSAQLTSSHNGVSVEHLKLIYNLMDVYVQMANCEGVGIPQLEAAACGIPVMSVNYSGMEDVINKLEASPINVQRYIRECLTGRYFACPDNNDFIRKLIELLSLPDMIRRKIGFNHRQKIIEHFNWDESYEILEKEISKIKPINWYGPPRIHKPAEKLPDNLGDDDFVKMAIVHVLGRPEMLNSYLHLRMLRDITWGQSLSSTSPYYYTEESQYSMRPNWRNYNREEAIKDLRRMVDFNNHWEIERVKKLKL